MSCKFIGNLDFNCPAFEYCSNPQLSRLSWIFLRAPVIVNWALRNIQGNLIAVTLTFLAGVPHLARYTTSWTIASHIVARFQAVTGTCRVASDSEKSIGAIWKSSQITNIHTIILLAMWYMLWLYSSVHKMGSKRAKAPHTDTPYQSVAPPTLSIVRIHTFHNKSIVYIG